MKSRSRSITPQPSSRSRRSTPGTSTHSKAEVQMELNEGELLADFIRRDTATAPGGPRSGIYCRPPSTHQARPMTVPSWLTGSRGTQILGTPDTKLTLLPMLDNHEVFERALEAAPPLDLQKKKEKPKNQFMLSNALRRTASTMASSGQLSDKLPFTEMDFDSFVDEAFKISPANEANQRRFPLSASQYGIMSPRASSTAASDVTLGEDPIPDDVAIPRRMHYWLPAESRPGSSQPRAVHALHQIPAIMKRYQEEIVTSKGWGLGVDFEAPDVKQIIRVPKSLEQSANAGGGTRTL